MDLGQAGVVFKSVDLKGETSCLVQNGTTARNTLCVYKHVSIKFLQQIFLSEAR